MFTISAHFHLSTNRPPVATMPLWREKRLTCFYCGCRSAISLPADTRHWRCTSCEAVNHLDEVTHLLPKRLEIDN